MKAVLLGFLAVLAACWLFFAAGLTARLLRAGERARGGSPCRLVVFMGGQEEAAEGFLRRLAAFRNRWWPGLEVAVVDCGGDRTGKIARLLAGRLGIPVIAGAFPGKGLGPAGKEGFYPAGKGVYLFDARGRTGKKLFCAPVFRFLEVKLREDCTE